MAVLHRSRSMLRRDLVLSAIRNRPIESKTRLLWRETNPYPDLSLLSSDAASPQMSHENWNIASGMRQKEGRGRHAGWRRFLQGFLLLHMIKFCCNLHHSYGLATSQYVNIRSSGMLVWQFQKFCLKPITDGKGISQNCTTSIAFGNNFHNVVQLQ